MKEIDDITLMAYADGELPADEATQVAEAIERDPKLQAKLDKHMKLKGLLRKAFDDISAEPLPTEVREIASNAKHPQSSGAVLSFPQKGWVIPTSIAAAVGLVLLMTNTLSLPQADYSLPQQVSSALQQTLNTVSDGTETQYLTVLESYKKTDDTYCRTFTFSAKDAAATKGLACQADGDWSVVAVALHIPDGAFLPAGEKTKTDLSKLLKEMSKLEENGEQVFLTN